MTLLDAPTTASRAAAQNHYANLLALREAGAAPETLPDIDDDVEWVLARDRTLTALRADGWWSGCSLPTRMAQVMLKQFSIRGAVGCFLAPSHSAMLRVALDALRPQQALIAVVPDLLDLSLMLHCEDFSQAIKLHRLWLVSGAEWADQLLRLLREREGLATPLSMIRSPAADAELIDPMIASAQQIFSMINGERAAALERVRMEWSRPRTGGLCVVASRAFQPWQDFRPALLAAAGERLGECFDSDDPLNSSPLRLARAAAASEALFTANTARSDLPGVVPEDLPWITWLTCARVPRFTTNSHNDHLIIADPRLTEPARSHGWPANQIHIGGWPTAPLGPATSPAHVALIADTLALDTPADLNDYSSHQVLWESIRAELSQNPFRAAEPLRFLSGHMQKLGVREEGFPRARFIEQLIVPAYMQALARLLISAGVPLRIYGNGWGDEFANQLIGPITDRAAMQSAVSAATALLHAWPGVRVHPIHATGRPVLVATDAASLLRQTRSAIQQNLPSCENVPAISAALIESIIRSIQY